MCKNEGLWSEVGDNRPILNVFAMNASQLTTLSLEVRRHVKTLVNRKRMGTIENMYVCAFKHVHKKPTII